MYVHESRIVDPRLTTVWPATIAPALLTRARRLKLEHDRLAAESLESFQPKLAKRVGELRGVTHALQEWQAAHDGIAELRALIADPAQNVELRDLAREDLVETERQEEDMVRSLTRALAPKDPFNDLPCLLEIRPGAGGDEAALFAGELLRMYKLLCARWNLQTSMLKYETTSVQAAAADGPLAEAIMEIESPGAYGRLRTEAGVHRVQRVPATESKGRTHTSAVSVVVLPSFPESSSEGQLLEDADITDPNSDYYVNVTDVRVDTMKSSGAGGQHVNTTDSAVRLTHIPTGTVVNMQDSRSQHQNRKKAWQVLRSRLAQAKRDAREEERMKLRRSAGAQRMGREDKIRTYNWAQQRVTDHRSGMTSRILPEVLEAGAALEQIMESVQTWMVDQEVQTLILEDEAEEKKKTKSK